MGSGAVEVPILTPQSALPGAPGHGSRKFLSRRIKDAVDEIDRLRRGKLSRDLQGFIDDHRLRCIGISNELSYARAENVTIHCGHPFHAPVLRVLLDDVIYFCLALNRNTKQVITEAARFLVNITALSPKSLSDLFRRLLSHVPLK